MTIRSDEPQTRARRVGPQPETDRTALDPGIGSGQPRKTRGHTLGRAEVESGLTAFDRSNAKTARVPVGSRPERWPEARPGPDERTAIAAGVGAVLRKARTSRRLSCRALARAAGCCDRTVGRIESGERRPRESMLRALTRVLDADGAGKLAEQLIAAAGDSLRADTPAGIRARRRRTRAAERRARVDVVKAQTLPVPRRIPREILRLLQQQGEGAGRPRRL